MLDECCSEMNLSRQPLLVVTRTVASPAVTGVLNPRLLLPADLIDTLSRSQLRLILLHELAHIKCCDLAFEWLWVVLQAIHWFNPILWIVGPIRRNDRELARDEMVLSITGKGQADAYGRTLLQLAQAGALPFFCPGLVGIFSDKRRLKRRLEMISRFTGKRLAATCAGAILIAVAASCALTNPRPFPAPMVVRQSDKTDKPVSITNEGEDDPVPPDEAATRATLDQQTASLEFQQVPFDQVIDRFRHITGLNFYVAWPELQRVGVNRTALVTARLHDIKISKSLELVFKAVEDVGYDHKLGYTIDGNLVTISTQRDLDKNVVTQRYDINDLIPASSQPYDMTRRENQIKDIQRFITSNAAPQTWKENGGEVGSISASTLRAVLLITTTPEIHHKIRGLLQTMRANQPPAAAINSKTAIDPVDENKIETCQYLISDLLFQPLDYFLPSSSTANANQSQDPALLRKARIADVKTYIQSNVAPTSWKEHGGSTGKIEADESNDFLMITQTHGHQREIINALETLRQNRTLQISVEARVLLMNEAAVESLPEPIHRRVAALSGVGRNRTDQMLSDEEVKQMTQMVSRSPACSNLSAPRLTLFSGQHAYIVVSEQQAYVRSMTASSSSSNGKVIWAFTPVVGNTDSTRLEVPCATSSAPDQRSTFIDMQPKLTRLIGLQPEYWAGPVSEHDAVIQKPVTVTYQRSVTCAVPAHSTLLCALTQTFSDPRDSKSLRPSDRKMNQAINRSIEQEKNHQAFLLITPKIIPGPVQNARQ